MILNYTGRSCQPPGAPQPSDPLCKPQAKRKASKMERSHDARLASLFSKTQITVLGFNHSVYAMDHQAPEQHCLKSPHSPYLACNWHSGTLATGTVALNRECRRPNQKRGVPILYESYPTPSRDLQVIPAAKVITRALHRGETHVSVHCTFINLMNVPNEFIMAWSRYQKNEWPFIWLPLQTLEPAMNDVISRPAVQKARGQVCRGSVSMEENADKAVPVGEGGKLYELNVWAMTLGRGKGRTVTMQAELEARSAIREH